MIRALEKPIDIAILVYFRFCVGIFMAQELINHLLIGKFFEHTSPEFHFSAFEWLNSWSNPLGMFLHYSITILAAWAVVFGLRYRISTVILFIGYATLFLKEFSEYNNHMYLYCLISFWLMWLPLGKEKLKTTAPAWMLYLILFHMSLAYFFGGVAKLNADWLRGTPMDIYLKRHGVSGSPLLFSWGGLLFDLFIVPALIWRKTRTPAFVVSVLFHLHNVYMFGLATFPWFSIMVTSMFFDPSWPRKIPYFSKLLPPEEVNDKETYKLQPLLVLALSSYVLVHLSLPLRHLLYPGVTSWTEQGHMFSWRMMLRDKRGIIKFWHFNPEKNQKTEIDMTQYLTKKQINFMMGKPEMILKFAHFLRRKYKGSMIIASTKVGLNGRPMSEMIKEGTNLAKEPQTLENYSWIEKIK